MTPIRSRESFALPNGITGGVMRRAVYVALSACAFISSAAAITIGAGATPSAQPLSRQQYEAAREAIEAGRAAALAHCERANATEREACRIEAAAIEMVRAAEVEQDYRRTPQSARALQRARIEARYQMDRTRCGALGGAKRDRCLIQVHAAKGRAMLDAAAPYEVRF